MQKILFYTRNNAEKHVIVKNILYFLSSIADVSVIPFASVFKMRKTFAKQKFDYVYHDDPIAYILFSFFGVKAKKIFHSLEMYEYQIDINNPKRIARFLVFLICHRLALKGSELVIFPNLLRRNFYLDKYKWLDVDKTAILKNIPRTLEGGGLKITLKIKLLNYSPKSLKQL
ncbi:hypothetical protein L0B52_03960 [Suttonella sp. R2A3]|uniref:hypothetical protein n=1 Tax=Suttonella sp. R2A3 TaxID=2908648 RepID=UPI001F15889A|nr:hypothetical protein [Suttonella sp. R2A3]UJF25313.1 hypothetical protein L0B52_03960 [Suttonella sp. R2A3]